MNKKILAMLLTISFMSAGQAWSHPPSRVEITPDKKKVELKISHSVTDPKTHFVGKVEVFKNGKSVAVEQLNGQTNASQQLVTVKVPKLKKGDIVEVKARCNKGGERSGKVTVS